MEELYLKYSGTLTVNLGTLKILWSSVTFPTTTTIFPSLPGFFIKRLILAMLIGGRLILDMNNLLRMIRLNLELVLRAKNRYSLTVNLK